MDEKISSSSTIIWYNIILDVLLINDSFGNVNLIEGIFYNTLKSNLKTAIASNEKQPFFSIGLSSSSKQSEVEWLITKNSTKRKIDINNKSPSIFSLGIYKTDINSKEHKEENI